MYREMLNGLDRNRCRDGVNTIDSAAKAERADYFCVRSYQSRNVSHFFVR